MSENKQKDILKWIIIGLLAVVVIILTLGLGIFIGEKKAKFSYRWGENYHLNFGGPREGFFISDGRGDAEGQRFVISDGTGKFIASHGVVGQIIKLDGDTVVVKDSRDETEKVVLVAGDTTIHKGQETITVSELEIDDHIVIIGSPNEQGQIEAKVIRVFGEGPIFKMRLPYNHPRPSPFF